MFWGLIMEPQRRYTQTVKKAFHISMAALDYSTSSDEPAQVMCGYEGRNYLLCTLRKPDVMQCPLDLNFEVGTELSFATNGKCHVHLTGYLNDELPGEFDEEQEEEEEEDVADEETAVKEKKKNKKRIKKESEENSPPPKKPKKENLSQDEYSDQNDEADSDEDESDESDFDVKALLEKSFGDSEDDTSFAAEEESGEEEEESDDEDAEDIEEEVGDESDEEADSDEEDEANVSTNSKKNKLMNGGPRISVTPKQKEKKQKEKHAVEGKTPTKEAVAKSPTKEAQSPKKKSLQGGVIVEEIREGQGPPAKNGKFVSVYYEGRLKQNNKLFDSTSKGAGFQFRLGSGEVIKGWDVGVAGMKVGGKRRIICPPPMAYGVKGSPPAIPPNSTLVFEVELKKVK